MNTGGLAEKSAWVAKVTTLEKHYDFISEGPVVLSGTSLLKHAPAAEPRFSCFLCVFPHLLV